MQGHCIAQNVLDIISGGTVDEEDNLAVLFLTCLTSTLCGMKQR